MDSSLLTELDAIPGLVRAAGVPDAAQQTAAWCLSRLPGLYRDFSQTYDCRYGDEIQRLVRGLLMALAGDPGAVESVTGKMRAMHTRLGLPALRLSPPKQARKAKRG
jgi:hypothetical protein